jgi:hypothetical protein
VLFVPQKRRSTAVQANIAIAIVQCSNGEGRITIDYPLECQESNNHFSPAQWHSALMIEEERGRRQTGSGLRYSDFICLLAACFVLRVWTMASKRHGGM